MNSLGSRCGEDRSTPFKASIAFYVALSWLGMVIHNRTELPQLSFLSPEYLLPTAISIFIVCGLVLSLRHRRFWSWLLVSWAGVHLVAGAWLSVLPFPFWPFTPEQSIRHYLAHVFYGLAQVPLLWRAIVNLSSFEAGAKS